MFVIILKTISQFSMVKLVDEITYCIVGIAFGLKLTWRSLKNDILHSMSVCSE